MKVFLSGYGKMGRMLEELALERGWEVVGHADITCPEAYETAHVFLFRQYHLFL